MPYTCAMKPIRLIGLVSLCCCLALPACGPSARNLSAQNDGLRQSNFDLERAVHELNDKLLLREQELAALRRQGGAEPIDGVDTPRLAGIELDRLTGVLPAAPPEAGGAASAENARRELRVYLRPIDQDGRVMTAAGTARVRLIHTPADGEPRTLLDRQYDADAFHASYRDGVTGTHYTLRATLASEVPEIVNLHVTFTDAATGRTYTTERVVSLNR